MNFHFPIHPVFVHFPIALFFASLIFEMMGIIFKREDLHQCGFWVFHLAVISTPLAVVSGLWEANKHHLHHPVIDLHRNLGLLTMGEAIFLTLILWYVKKRLPSLFRGVYLISLLLIVMAVFLTAYQGGRLVYEYAIGVEL